MPSMNSVEDPLDHRRGHGIGLEAAKALAVGGLAGIGVGSGVGETVAVGRPPTEVAALACSLGGHGRADAVS